MKILILIIIIVAFCWNRAINQTFIENLKKHKRVQEAISEKQAIIEVLLLANNLKIDSFEVFIRIFKKEKLLELWGKNKNDKNWKLIKIYSLCIKIGPLGPRVNKIDELPEGVYNIDNFDAESSFVLALKLNYPNPVDNFYIQSSTSPVYICGQCFSLGNFGISEPYIKELFLFAIYAVANGQSKIPVHIFPCRMNDENLKILVETNNKYEKFWASLASVYKFFENNKIIPNIILNADGTYHIK
ncbi:MAG: hypothetical protein N3A01_09185 [Bacteroidales bacterium]|nr:hypothetical protein [Bacteroidales bacterium]